MRARARHGAFRRLAPRPWALLVASLLVGLCGLARADNFVWAYYEADTDQLVVAMSYRGTNPDHVFTLRWGKCRTSADGTAREIVAEVLDSEWQDAAVKTFKKTTRFDLGSLDCRPAKLTLRTAPRFLYTLRIPARPSP